MDAIKEPDIIFRGRRLGKLLSLHYICYYFVIIYLFSNFLFPPVQMLSKPGYLTSQGRIFEMTGIETIETENHIGKRGTETGIGQEVELETENVIAIETVIATSEMTEIGTLLEKGLPWTTVPEKGEMIETGDLVTESGKVFNQFCIVRTIAKLMTLHFTFQFVSFQF